MNVMLQGRRTGPLGFPTALETEFGWVLAGSMKGYETHNVIVANISNVMSCDDLLRAFWEIEEHSAEDLVFTCEEKMVL